MGFRFLFILLFPFAVNAQPLVNGWSNTPSPVDTSTIQGFGSQAIGGSLDATVYHVTTVSGTGAGSLYYGLNTAPRDHKTIVFDVSGTINQRHDITDNEYITIDGTTAPYPGIIITTGGGDGMSVQNATSHHIIIKGLTFKNCSNDGLNVIDGAHDVAVLNCSSYGNEDGDIDFSGCSYATMQYCIIGNHNGSASGNTGGTLVVATNVSIHHNLFYPIPPNPDEGERFPFCHCNYICDGQSINALNADIRNNLVWQFGRANATGSGFGTGIGYNSHANIVNNFYQTTGPTTASSNGVDLQVDGTTGLGYTSGNVSGNGYNFNTGSYYNTGAHAGEWIVPDPYKITVESACASNIKILAQAGITQRSSGNRTPAEAAYINGVTGITGCP